MTPIGAFDMIPSRRFLERTVPMNRRWLTIGCVGLILQGTSLVAGTRLDTEPEHGRQERPPILRSAVDVIAIDVQVIDTSSYYLLALSA